MIISFQISQGFMIHTYPPHTLSRNAPASKHFCCQLVDEYKYKYLAIQPLHSRIIIKLTIWTILKCQD